MIPVAVLITMAPNNGGPALRNQWSDVFVAAHNHGASDGGERQDNQHNKRKRRFDEVDEQGGHEAHKAQGDEVAPNRRRWGGAILSVNGGQYWC